MNIIIKTDEYDNNGILITIINDNNNNTCHIYLTNEDSFYCDEDNLIVFEKKTNNIINIFNLKEFKFISNINETHKLIRRRNK